MAFLRHHYRPYGFRWAHMGILFLVSRPFLSNLHKRTNISIGLHL